MTKQLTRIKLRLCYYGGPIITKRLTTDWVCVKTDVSRMFHEGKKGGWFTCILTRLKIQAYLCKNVVNKNTVRKFYVGITLIQKKKNFLMTINRLLHLTSMRNNNPELQYTRKKKITKHYLGKIIANYSRWHRSNPLVLILSAWNL